MVRDRSKHCTGDETKNNWTTERKGPRSSPGGADVGRERAGDQVKGSSRKKRNMFSKSDREGNTLGQQKAVGKISREERESIYVGEEKPTQARAT